jgi:hypothetical protein
VPREWIGSGKPIRAERVPTRWGRVTFDLVVQQDTKVVTGNVELSGASFPKEVHLKLRLPKSMPLQGATVNGHPAAIGGIHQDTVIISTAGKRSFQVIGQLG